MKIIHAVCLSGLLFACTDAADQQSAAIAKSEKYAAVANKMAEVAKPTDCRITSHQTALLLDEADVISSNDPGFVRNTAINSFLGYLKTNHLGGDVNHLGMKMTTGVCA